MTHCSDEKLLCFLDGELSHVAGSSVKKHLDTCWQCRTRLAELEQQIHSISQAIEEPRFPGPAWMAHGRQKLAASQREFEGRFSSAPELKLAPQASWLRAAAFAAALGLALVALGAWFLTHNATPEAQKILALARQAEENSSRADVHQIFSVEVLQLKPDREKRESRLEVWAEAGDGRFASRWKDEAGRLKHGIWQPRDEKAVIYNPARGSGLLPRAAQPPAVMSLADLVRFGFDPHQLESGFMQWLESRPWKPLSIASEFAAFSREAGSFLRVERRRFDGKTVFLLRGRRNTPGQQVEFVMAIDEETYQPRLTKLRLQSGARIVEFHLKLEEIEYAPSGRFVPAIFEPDVPAVKQDRRLAEGEDTLGERPLQQQQAPEATPSAPPQRKDAAMAEVEVRYALHRQGHCLSGAVQVSPDPRLGLKIRGLVDSEEERQILLGSLPDVPLLSAKIDVISDASRAAEGPDWAAAEIEQPALRIRGGKLALEEYLHARQSSEQKTPPVSWNLTEISAEAVSSCLAARRHAWALLRLLDRYQEPELDGLPLASLWLLDTMVREHAQALRSEGQQVRLVLAPVLAAVGQAADPAAENNEQFSAMDSVGAATWRQNSRDLVELVERRDRLVKRLFADPRFPVEEVENTVGELLEAFLDFEQRSRNLEKQFASGEPLFAPASGERAAR